MKNSQGKLCPACRNDIGLLAIFEAVLPTRITCPHCDEKLRYAEMPWFSLTACIVAWIGVFLFFLPATGSVLLDVLLMIIAWMPFEAFLVWQARQTNRLELRKKDR